MHGHRVHQPLRRRGLTLVELAVGIALSGVVALVSAGLFKAGILTFNYAYRQTRTLSSARKALAGDGDLFGMVWTAQTAKSVDALSPASLTVTPAGGFSTTFAVSNNNLYVSLLGTQTLQAETISSVAVQYYNMDANGLIMVSTAAASATFVTTQVSMAGTYPKDKTYTFLSGAQLRNHQ